MPINNVASAVDLSVSPVHLDSIAGSEAPAVLLENFGFDGPAFEDYVAKHCQAGPGRIVMIETSPVDWSHWERHTEGDEIVVILEGRGVMIQQFGDAEQSIPLRAGQAVVNPCNVWHTANVESALKALYITPARGTEHRTR
ncbi:MAG: cupin domain-containing protein [Pseudomonadales bacterium]|nr:cupin domain-containing protein [Pseudomonadales bacterium]